MVSPLPRDCYVKPAPHAVALPIAPRPTTIKKSYAGRWRAAVLIAVHLLIAVHVAHWLHAGSTFTPLEPSEAMEFSKKSIINVGLIFFALTILSTLVLGRWFCGWACHLVALQDLSRWMLGKIGLRPKPLRAGILGVVPLLAFLYMFVAPFIYRWLGGDSFALRGTHLTTEHFWATFPGLVAATLTFVVCGFVAVYFLGSKGFCTYGCPYGAVFGATDQLAPMRIRVTDACQQCAHCTAVCSSNVRVHEEVRDFGMVVDPGCMKCLDCVNVCPNDALYVGWGTPALLAPRRTRSDPSNTPQQPPAEREAASTSPSAAPRVAGLSAGLVTALFVFASYVLFTGFDRKFAWQRADWIVSAALTLVTLGVLFLLRGKSTRKQDYTLTEQGLLGGIFLLAMFAFRGLYDLVAYLFALGLSAVLAYLGVTALRLLRRPNLSMHGWRLKRAGVWQPPAYAFASGIVALAMLWVHSGVLQYHRFRVFQLQEQIRQLHASAVGPAATGLEQRRAQLADAALRHAGLVERWALLRMGELALPSVRMLRIKGEYDQYEKRMARLMEARPDDLELAGEFASYLTQRRDYDRAIALYRGRIERHPDAIDTYLGLGLLLTTLHRFDEARDVYERGIRAAPGDARLQQHYGILEAEQNNLPAALERFRAAAALDPASAETRVLLARALCALGRRIEGLNEYQAALRIQPANVNAHLHLGLEYLRDGRIQDAQDHFEKAVTYDPTAWEAHLALAEVLAARGDPAGARRHRDRAVEINPALAGGAP